MPTDNPVTPPPARIASALPKVLYGTLNGDLVLIRKVDADELVAVRRALDKATTWGEFKALAPDAHEELVGLLGTEEDEAVSDDEADDADSFDADLGGAPADSASFSGWQIGPVMDGDFPAMPEAMMLGWVPEAIQREFGTVEQTSINGEVLSFDAENTTAIIAALTSLGYECVEDPVTVKAAAGY